MDEGYKAIESFQVLDEDQNIRIDRWFKRHFPNISFLLVAQLLRKGSVRVNRKRQKQSYKLQCNDIITVRKADIYNFAMVTSKHVTINKGKYHATIAKQIHNSVLYSDENIIAINKPSGFAVQGGTNIKISLDDVLHLLQSDNQKPKLVHRIDKDTSGVIVIAKNNRTATELGRLFKSGDVIKYYLALCYGVPKIQNGTISTPLCKMKWYQNKEYVAYCPINGKEAITHYKVQLVNSDKTMSLIRFQIVTGRTHQIRAHAAMSGIPIFGDVKYNSKYTSWVHSKINREKSVMKILVKQVTDDLCSTSTLCLHSAYISMILFGKKIELHAPLQKSFMDVLLSKGFNYDATTVRL